VNRHIFLYEHEGIAIGERLNLMAS